MPDAGMSDAGRPGRITRGDLWRAVETSASAIESGRVLSAAEWLEIGRLWNTISHDTGLMAEPRGSRFFELVRDRGIPAIVDALHMKVGRGFSFHSTTFDFVLGGVLDERYRLRVEDEP